MLEKARVLEKKGNKAIVLLKPKESCHNCSSKSMCYLSRGAPLQLETENEIEAGPGDIVDVEIPTGNLISSSFLLYILPAIFFVATVSFSLQRGRPELMALVIGGLSLVIAFFILFLIDKSYFLRKNKQPKIVRLVKKGVMS